MKKYWLIPLMILAGSPYANSCGGQFDPASGTCRIIGPDGKMILYNSAPPQSGYSGGYSSDDYSNAPSQPIPSYAAIAVNRNTGDWGWSTGTLTEFSAMSNFYTCFFSVYTNFQICYHSIWRLRFKRITDNV